MQGCKVLRSTLQINFMYRMLMSIINNEFLVMQCIHIILFVLDVICLRWSIFSHWKKNLAFPKRPKNLVQKIKNWKRNCNHYKFLYQRINLLAGLCCYFATIIPLVTNAGICVALYPCNAQKRNAYWSVGILSSNAYMNI